MASLLGLSAACTSSPPCDAASLQASLTAAAAGATVRVGACTIEGGFVVPAGVSLVGDGVGRTILRRADPVGAVVRLAPGAAATPTTLAGLSIESASRVGILASGAGSVHVRDVHIAAAEGVGIALRGLDAAVIERVDLVGPIPQGPENPSDAIYTAVATSAPDHVEPIASPPFDQCTPDERRVTATVRQFCDGDGHWVSVLATQGLALSDVADATLTDVTITGFAQLGLLATGSGGDVTRWTGGAATGNMGIGIFADGVALTLTDVVVERTYSGFRTAPAAAAYVGTTGGATTLTTTRLTIADNFGYGLVHVGASAEHEGLEAVGNDLAGVWVGGSTHFVLRGSMIAGNQFAGLVVIDSSDVAVETTTVAGTMLRTARVGAAGIFGSVELGDGIQLFGSTSDVSLTSVMLDGNARLGLSVDLGEVPAPGRDWCAGGTGLCFTDVTVAGTGSAHGALAGTMRTVVEANVFSVETVPVGCVGCWDTGISRSGSAAMDAAFVGEVELVGVIAPLDTPLPVDLVGVIAPLD